MATKGNTMKYYYVLLLTLVIVSCNSNQQKSSSSNKETPQLSTAQDSVPEGWYNETLTPYTGKDKAEKNMISQMNTYNQALLRGDINNASLYIYPDVIKYCKKYYPELSDRAIIQTLYKDMSEMYHTLKTTYDEKGIDYNIIVSNITNRVADKEYIIITFEVVGVLTQGEKCIHDNPETNIGVSHNKGKNWTFLALTDDVPNILRMRFDEEIINKIIKYFEENPKTNPIQMTLSLLFSFYSNLMLTYYAPDKSEQGIANMLGLRTPWQARDYMAAMRKYSGVKTMQIVGEIRYADAKSKGVQNSSMTDGDILRELVFKILH